MDESYKNGMLKMIKQLTIWAENQKSNNIKKRNQLSDERAKIAKSGKIKAFHELIQKLDARKLKIENVER